MPYDGWASTMMGNSMRDPLFLAAWTVANQDSPGSGSLCLKCHSPSSYVRGHSQDDGGQLDAIDLAGVQCEVCHRSMVPDGGMPLEGNGQLVWDPGLVKHGPYSPSYSPVHDTLGDAFTSQSALCGQCHQLWNPGVTWHVDGGDTGMPMPLDTTFDEWKGSALADPMSGQTCQNCHMPALMGQHIVGKTGPARTDPRRHVFVGGNAWGVQAVLAANPQLAVISDDFTQTQSEALAQLRRAAEVTLQVPASAHAGESIEAVVRVTNLTGHKLPTGYADGRRVFLEVSFNGQVTSGAYDVDAGMLLADPQLRVYEAVHGRADAGAESHLVLHDSIIKDSRIPPAGFQPVPWTRPVGVSWFNDGDGGFRSFDEAAFSFTLPSAQPVHVVARLLYQPTTREYVDFLSTENHTDARGTTLQSIFQSTGGAAPIEMARAEADVGVPQPGACGCSAAEGASTLALALFFLRIWRSRASRA